jgi:hypothetical protein
MIRILELCIQAYTLKPLGAHIRTPKEVTDGPEAVNRHAKNI